MDILYVLMRVEDKNSISGTCKIELAFNQMEIFLNLAGYFVSRKSGIDDITVGA